MEAGLTEIDIAEATTANLAANTVLVPNAEVLQIRRQQGY